MASVLDEQLSCIFSSLPEENAVTALEILTTLYQNIEKYPDQDQYRRVRTSNKRFNQCVWTRESVKQFLLLGGWVEAGEFIVYVGEDVQISLECLRKRMPRHNCTQQVAATPVTIQHDNTGISKERQAQLKLLKEHQQKIAEEKKRISEKIKADRQEAAQKEIRSSQSRVLSFGGNINRFEDIGVDLNKGG